jgi:hypothetical protein
MPIAAGGKLAAEARLVLDWLRELVKHPAPLSNPAAPLGPEDLKPDGA